MNVVEIEVPIKGKKEEIEKTLLENDFEVFFKVLTITSYYLPNNENIGNHKTLKDRCKRIRYVVPIDKFINANQDYRKWIKRYNADECKTEENELLDKGYKKIYTDIKTDFVYKNKKNEDMFFQIQDILEDCLIVAYDNKNYYEYEESQQREMLLSDVKKYGIKIIDENNIDRFKLVGNIKSIEEIIEILNIELEKLEG